MPKNDVSPCLMRDCPVSSAMPHIGSKWKFTIIWQLNKKDNQRFSELKKSIPEITERVFIREIKEMEQSGLVDRIDYHQVPPKVEYKLTKTGKELIPVIDLISKWSIKNGFHKKTS